MKPVQTPSPHLSRIPGVLPKIQPEKYFEDLSNLDKPKLLEIFERQEQILRKSSQLSKLPDKGARIKEFYEKIVKELKNRDEIEKAAELFSDLNIASTGQEKLINLEWTGKCEKSDINENEVLDSDDEADPIKILAQSMDVKKKVKVLPPEPKLITEADLEEIKSFSSPLEPYALHIIERKEYDGLPQTEKFKPYKTTKGNVHNAETEMHRKVGKNWESTSATPPLIKHPGVKMLSLQDSVDIQMKYLYTLKSAQKKQAEERLAKKMERLEKMKLPDEQMRRMSEFFTSYRSNETEEEMVTLEGVPVKEYEDNNLFDEDDDKDGRGTVNYTVYE
ncbi:POLR2M family protein [Megaselia abdita]